MPVLNVGAAGGLGPYSEYCLGLLGSSDITDLSVQLLPDEEALFDIGHIDLWIEAHTHGGGRSAMAAHDD